MYLIIPRPTTLVCIPFLYCHPYFTHQFYPIIFFILVTVPFFFFFYYPWVRYAKPTLFLHSFMLFLAIFRDDVSVKSKCCIHVHACVLICAWENHTLHGWGKWNVYSAWKLDGHTESLAVLCAKALMDEIGQSTSCWLIWNYMICCCWLQSWYLEWDQSEHSSTCVSISMFNSRDTRWLRGIPRILYTGFPLVVVRKNLATTLTFLTTPN